MDKINSEMLITDDNVKCWCLPDGKLHREDGPAVIDSDGKEYWYIDDKLHREDGPAVIDSDGSQRWYIDDKLHREDGPAIIHMNGDKHWFYKGMIHRKSGPAIICGTRKIYANMGLLHNLNGSAVKCFGHKLHNKYFVYGYLVSKEEFTNIKSMLPDEIHFYSKLRFKNEPTHKADMYYFG